MLSIGCYAVSVVVAKKYLALRRPGIFYESKTRGGKAYILVFVLPLPDDIVLFCFLLFIVLLSLVLIVLSMASGAPVAGRPRELSALLGLRAGAALLGVRVAGLLGLVCAGVVWAKAALVLQNAAATRK
jgi:hypothetical protein